MSAKPFPIGGTACVSGVSGTGASEDPDSEPDADPASAGGDTVTTGEVAASHEAAMSVRADAVARAAWTFVHHSW